MEANPAFPAILHFNQFCKSTLITEHLSLWKIRLTNSNGLLLARAAIKLKSINLRETNLSAMQLDTLLDTISNSEETKLEWLNVDGNNLRNLSPSKLVNAVKR